MSSQEPRIGEEVMFEKLSNRIQAATTWSSNLEGRLLTLIDAMVSDKEQKTAFKSIVKQAVRDHYREINGETMNLIAAFTEAYNGEIIRPVRLMDHMDGRVYDWVKMREDEKNGTSPHAINPFSGK